jgi:branched-chain amino acid transport system ATP-binding protein
MRIAAGEVVLLTGRNGSGRSTLVAALAGLLPRTGEVTVAGHRVPPCEPAAAVRAGIVAVPERRQLFPHLTVEDHLVLGLYALGPRLVRTARRTVTGSDVYDLFPVLRERRRQLAGTLSGGEQQMLAVARALISRPSVIVLDEPFLGLAPVAARTVAGSLDGLRAARRAVLLVDEQRSGGNALADRVLTLRDGRLAPDGGQ